jgi:hypothetical protein
LESSREIVSAYRRGLVVADAGNPLDAAATPVGYPLKGVLDAATVRASPT